MAESTTEAPARALSVRLTQQLEHFPLQVEFEAQAPIVCLYGPSGSGKSSCLELIAGVRRPDSGRIVVGGTTLFDDAEGIDLAPGKRRIGWVPQDGLLFPHLTVRRNLLFGHRSGAISLEQTVRFLEIEALLDRRTRHLSGGEVRRVALGRALLTNHEPFSGLDQPLRQRLMPLFRRVADELEIQMLLVSHLPDEVRALADRVVLLDEGRVTRVVSPQELTPVETDPINLLLGRLVEPGVVEVDGAALVHVPTGDRAPGAWLRLALPASAIVLAPTPGATSSMRNRFAGRIVSLTEHQGSVLVTLDVGTRLLAVITPAAAAELQLVPGAEIHARFKATAVRVV